MTRTHRPLTHALGLSMGGSLMPALVAVAATVVANTRGDARTLVILLSIWTVGGYLTLTDFGLTRSAAKLVAEGGDPRAVIRRLRPVSLRVGAGLSMIGATVLVVLGATHPTVPVLLWFLVPLPLATALQFPLVGALEASGRFGVLAGHRLLNALSVYLGPALCVPLGKRGLILGLALMWSYRLAALGGLAAFLPRATPHPALSRPAEPLASIVGWIGLSSMLGPALLYLDRAFVPMTGASLWISYVSLSEILLRSYVIPASIMAVVFPWTVRRLRSDPAMVRRVFGTWLPVVTVGGALVAGGVLALSPDALYRAAGVGAASVGSARSVAVLLVVGTVINWSSQAQITLAQAAGAQRGVVLAQAALLIPFVACLAWGRTVGVVAVAAVWAGRIVLLWLILRWFASAAVPLPERRRPQAVASAGAPLPTSLR